MKKINNLLIIISIILAIVFGIYFKDFVNNIIFLGNVYIKLLKFMILPILFTTIMSTFYETKKYSGSLILKTIITFISMFIITFLITSIIVFLLNPGNNYSYNNIEWEGTISQFNINNIIVNIIPSNIGQIFDNSHLLFSIILASVAGLISAKVPYGDKVISVINGIKNIAYKVLEYILYLTPIGVFSLLGSSIANYGSLIFDVGIKYILVAYLCTIIVLILVMILPVWIIAKINPFTYIKKISKLWFMTVSTCSSQATLPLTMKTCNKDLNISNKITDIVVPLGCTIHMCGGAVSFSLLSLFSLQLFGIELSLSLYLLMIMYALIINMAAPGIPNGGIGLGATYLTILGIALTFIGFYSGIYKLLDMAYTTLNVTGDVTANILINKYTKE